MRLVHLLGDEDNIRGPVREEFSRLPQCCTPTGIRDLRAFVTHPDDCDSEVFLNIVREFASNVEFTNYESELTHARMRYMLSSSQGLTFAHVASQQLGFDIGKEHGHRFATAQQPRRQGRPSKPPTKKRKRCDGWNMFVAMHKPTCAPSQAGKAIKSGEHMRALGARWRVLTPAEKEPYQAMAAAKQAALAVPTSDEEPDAEEEAQNPEDIIDSAWSIGSPQCPLSASRLDTPAFTEEFAREVDAISEDLDQVISHLPNALPFRRTSYCSACAPGYCVGSPHFELASTVRADFGKLQSRRDLSVLSAYIFLGQAAGVAFSRCVLVAHKFDAPLRLVFLCLQPCEPTTLAHIESGANVPWKLKLKRVRSRDRDYLDFVEDGPFFLDLVQSYKQRHCDELSCKQLTFEPLGLDTLEVPRKTFFPYYSRLSHRRRKQNIKIIKNYINN